MRLIKFGKYRGFRKVGTQTILKNNRHIHLERASWLTAMVESNGQFGSIFNADGTGMTAGIHQAIAVYPRELLHPDKNIANDQGPLWRLLNKIYPYTTSWPLWDMFREIGWAITLDNRLIYIESGKPVDGFKIRNEFNGSTDGITPKSGSKRKRAEQWVEEFHKVFCHPATFNIQEIFGMEHFAKRATRTKLRFSRKFKKETMNSLLYVGTTCDTATFKEQQALDLALCMYWSHSVNAPSMALKVLCKTLDELTLTKVLTSSEELATSLINKLGKCKYGRWSDNIKQGRYQRTRQYAMKSGFWPEELFKSKDAIMPVNL